MKLKTLLITLLSSMTVMGSMNAEDEEMLDILNVPDAVQETIYSFISLLPENAELDELLMENDSESVVYEVEIKVPGGIEYEVEINNQVKILKIEMEYEDDKYEENETN